MALFSKKSNPKKEEVKKDIVALEQSLDDSKSVNSNSTEIFCQPYVTEKATFLTQNNQYVFIVSKFENKIIVKNFVQKKYKVKVADVNMIRLTVTPKRFGPKRDKSYKGAYKKAIVTLKQGYKIDLAI